MLAGAATARSVNGWHRVAGDSCCAAAGRV